MSNIIRTPYPNTAHRNLRAARELIDNAFIKTSCGKPEQAQRCYAAAGLHLDAAVALLPDIKPAAAILRSQIQTQPTDR